MILAASGLTGCGALGSPALYGKYVIGAARLSPGDEGSPPALLAIGIRACRLTVPLLKKRRRVSRRCATFIDR
jgi:hypothetical protein